MSENKKNKHLTYEERTYLELGLNRGRKIVDISKDIFKDSSTIAKEIKRNSFKKIPSSFNNSGNLCKDKLKCKKFDCTEEKECYEEEICIKLLKSPHVCNGCDDKTKCRKIKKYYYAKFANVSYKDTLVNSRTGINITQSEIYDIDKLITPLIKENNQTIHHVYVNNPDILSFSKPTFYTYIDKGIFSVRNIDLQRRVKYKPRKNTEKQRVRRETVIRKGRTYKDFKEYIEKNPDISIVEMDTVEGVKGGKVFLTMLFRGSKLMLVFSLEKKNMECVGKVFKQLKETLGISTFKKLFAVILTDNGSEFFDPISIENSENNEPLIKLFYCDAGASWQKGAVEKNHEYIRYILPKGSSFNDLNQEDVDIIANNINNVNREILNNKTPYEASQLLMSEEILNKLNMKKIEADKVNLSQKILQKHKD